jgi:hypothetical protein
MEKPKTRVTTYSMDTVLFYAIGKSSVPDDPWMEHDYTYSVLVINVPVRWYRKFKSPTEHMVQNFKWKANDTDIYVATENNHYNTPQGV